MGRPFTHHCYHGLSTVSFLCAKKPKTLNEISETFCFSSTCCNRKTYQIYLNYISSVIAFMVAFLKLIECTCHTEHSLKAAISLNLSTKVKQPQRIGFLSHIYRVFLISKYKHLFMQEILSISDEAHRHY